MYTYKEGFVKYLKESRGLLDVSVSAYDTDLEKFGNELAGKGIKNIAYANSSDLVAYVARLNDTGVARSTVNRRTASIRTYYRFLFESNAIAANPAMELKTPRISRQGVEYLSYEEVEALMNSTDESPSGIRDKAILELLYATGIKVLELIDLDTSDINLRMGFISCNGKHGRVRIIPLNSKAKEAIELYQGTVREEVLAKRHEQIGKVTIEKALFLNKNGTRLTRQTIWKTLLNQGKKAGINREVNGHLIRATFAVHMIANGADMNSMLDFMGYEDAVSLEGYISVVKKRIKDVYDKTHPRA